MRYYNLRQLLQFTAAHTETIVVHICYLCEKYIFIFISGKKRSQQCLKNVSFVQHITVFAKGRVEGSWSESSKVARKAAGTRKDELITAGLSAVTSVWVSDACYKRNTDSRNFNRTVTGNDDCDRNQQNQS